MRFWSVVGSLIFLLALALVLATSEMWCKFSSWSVSRFYAA